MGRNHHEDLHRGNPETRAGENEKNVDILVSIEKSEICIDRCQMDAVAMDGDNIAVVKRDRCIGCGLCVITCDAEAMKLMPKPDEEHRIPPATTAEQMRIMAKNWGLI